MRRPPVAGGQATKFLLLRLISISFLFIRKERRTFIPLFSYGNTEVLKSLKLGECYRNTLSWTKTVMVNGKNKLIETNGVEKNKRCCVDLGGNVTNNCEEKLFKKFKS